MSDEGHTTDADERLARLIRDFEHIAQRDFMGTARTYRDIRAAEAAGELVAEPVTAAELVTLRRSGWDCAVDVLRSAVQDAINAGGLSAEGLEERMTALEWVLDHRESPASSTPLSVTVNYDSDEAAWREKAAEYDRIMTPRSESLTTKERDWMVCNKRGCYRGAVVMFHKTSYAGGVPRCPDHAEVA